MNDLFKPHQCPRCFGLFEVGDRFWNDSGIVYHLMCWVNKSKEKKLKGGHAEVKPLYTHPPQRTEQGDKHD